MRMNFFILGALYILVLILKASLNFFINFFNINQYNLINNIYFIIIFFLIMSIPFIYSNLSIVKYNIKTNIIPYVYIFYNFIFAYVFYTKFIFNTF